MSGQSHKGSIHRLIHPDLFDYHSLVGNALSTFNRIQYMFTNVFRSRLNTSKETELFEKFETYELRLTTFNELSLSFLNRPRGECVSLDSDFTAIQQLGEDILSSLECIHRGYAQPIGLNNIRNNEKCQLLTDLLLPICKDVMEREVLISDPYNPEKPKIEIYDKCTSKIAKTPFEAYIIWDEPTVNTVRNILTNVKHAYSLIENPLNSENAQKAHLWLSFASLHNQIEIYLFNQKAPGLNANDIEERTRTKQIKWFLQEINGNILFDDYDQVNNILRTTIKIPYAHTIRKTYSEALQ